MSELVNILFYVFFFGGLIGMVALWTQYDLNQEKEKKAKAVKPPQSQTQDDAA
jgi:hypothetical protein